MEIQLHNTLGNKKEVFSPIDPKVVTMYSCGPTVYNYLHIGNLRAYVFADILKRTLIYNGYKVKHVMNVTDIGHLTSDADEGEDKMVKALKREGKEMTLKGLKEVGRFYFEKAKEDMGALNILPADLYPFASDEIASQVEMIEKLLEKDFAYKTSDGIYFDTERLPDYGKLGGVASEEHSRIGLNPEKKNIRDFALWKFSGKFSENEDRIGFDASFGNGFPGWHIECSAMSMKYLGDQFDIHTGGIDHIPVHHNNEIAQSEALTGKVLANYWLHSEHLTIATEKGSDKMAKSGDNFLTLDYLKKENIDPIAYRYWLLMSRYSTRIDYSLEAIKAAQTALNKLKTIWDALPCHGEIDSDYKDKFTKAINDDLDAPKGLALIWEILKDEKVRPEDKKATIYGFDKILGLDIANETKEKETLDIPEDVKELLEKRKIARENGDFALSDSLRKDIENKGFSINDGQDGSQNLDKK